MLRVCRYAFDYFDSDGSGQITLGNLMKIFGSAQHAREVLGEEGVDIDGDSKISFEEFKTMMMSHHGDRQRTLRYTKRDPAFADRHAHAAAAKEGPSGAVKAAEAK